MKTRTFKTSALSGSPVQFQLYGSRPIFHDEGVILHLFYCTQAHFVATSLLHFFAPIGLGAHIFHLPFELSFILHFSHSFLVSSRSYPCAEDFSLLTRFFFSSSSTSDGFAGIGLLLVSKGFFKDHQAIR
jgi:hypothetical protein